MSIASPTVLISDTSFELNSTPKFSSMICDSSARSSESTSSASSSAVARDRVAVGAEGN